MLARRALRRQWAFPRAWRSASSSTASTESAEVKSFDDIPSPKPMPFFGHALTLKGDFLNRSHLAHQRLKREYGDVVRIDIPGVAPFVFLYNPDLAKDMYQMEGRFPHSPGFDPFVFYRKNFKKHLYPTTAGLVGEQGEQWYDVRSKVQQVMMRPESALFYLDSLTDIADDFVHAIRTGRKSDTLEYADTEGSRDPILNLLHLWAFESICAIFLNAKVGALPSPNAKQSEESLEFVRAIGVVFKHSQKLMMGIPFWKYLPKQMVPWFNEYDAMHDKVHKLAHAHIDKAKAELAKDPDWRSRPEDEMSLLAKLMSKIDDETVPVVMAMDGMGAGIDTTGNTAAFLLYHLAANPEKQELLHQELIKVFGKDGKTKKVTKGELSQLSYLRACLQESQRLTPVFAGTARQTVRECVVGGYRIPEGVALIQMGHLIGTQEDNFTQADKFIPERWLRGQKAHHPFASLPFGHGPRMCIGRRFATLEVSLATIRTVQNFSMEFKHPPLEVDTTFVNFPAAPLAIAFKDR